MLIACKTIGVGDGDADRDADGDGQGRGDGTGGGDDGNGNVKLCGHLTGGPIIHLFLGAGFAFAFLGAAFAQGLTLVHFSAQDELFL